MTFEIVALDPKPFVKFFMMTDDQLFDLGARRVVASSDIGFPCRVSLEDAREGEALILLNFEHLTKRSPYRSCHAIYVREKAVQARPDVGETPDVLTKRLLSLRAFDEMQMMMEADVIEGADLKEKLIEYFSINNVAYVDIHNAKPGCFAARAIRA